MKRTIAVLLALVFSMTCAASAQKVFDKPYTKWSKGDAEKILSESPWITTYQSAELAAAIDKEAILKNQDNLSIRPGARATDARAQRANLAAPAITVRLHSASVVRQAIVRLQQLSQGYDRLDDEKKAVFDASTKDLIDCPYCRNYYIVTMSKALDSSNRSVEDGLFQTINPAEMKGKVFLVNDTGLRSPLAQFIPPKGSSGEAVLFFPRRNTLGHELITPENKTFEILFDGTFFTSSNPYGKIIPTSFRFEVKDLIHGDKVIF
jgi:hypothetical protein